MIGLVFVVIALVVGGALGTVVWMMLSKRNQVDQKVVNHVSEAHTAILALERDISSKISTSNPGTRNAIMKQLGQHAFKRYQQGGDPCLPDF